VEEKEYAVVWHYRMADPVFGDWLANELVSTLERMLAETELRAVRGQKTVEVRLAWANKGEMLGYLQRARPDAQVIAAFGDDRTDEDLFERLPESAWMVKVGDTPSRARYRVAGPDEVRAVLRRLVLPVPVSARR
jgi:trehalose 6-phosphate synthase/phosphatase